MIQALNTSGTGMVAQQYNLDVISNNLANVNTTGFKQQRAEFQDLMYETIKGSGIASDGSTASPVTLQIGLGTQFSATAANFAPGALQSTSNPLDMAINGQGFFKLKRADGTFAYTRDGAFKEDADGKLVSSDGLPLEPPVTIPKGATSISVASDGSISVQLPDTPGQTTILDSKIQVTVFQNPGGMVRIGQNLFIANEASGTPVEGQPGQNGSGDLRPGFLEGSNVQVVEEMVRMILAQRAYELNSKAIQSSDEMLGVINNLKR